MQILVVEQPRNEGTYSIEKHDQTNNNWNSYQFRKQTPYTLIVGSSYKYLDQKSKYKLMEVAMTPFGIILNTLQAIRLGPSLIGM